MTPKEQYQIEISKKGFSEDPAQARIIDIFENLHHRLIEHDKYKSSSQYKLKQLLGRKHTTAVTGLYLWGGVGRGKTWLMDLFFDTLPFNNKIRLHFHHFMQAVHDQLSLLKGHRDPLILVAKNFAKKSPILCLDEFHVSDITDAMLLYGLLDALFKEGVTLIATSNQQPDDLYKHGLQRDRFLPAIKLIKENTESVNISGDIDHRLRLLEKAETWYPIIDETTEDVLRSRFEQLSPCSGVNNEILHINHRNIKTVSCADDVAWFEFNALCDGPRASADYIEIARLFHTVFISNIPEMNDGNNDKARRFINMIDEFYDRNIKLIASADTLPQDIYQGRQLVFEFQRTVSRLEEMRSHDYLARPHKP